MVLLAKQVTISPQMLFHWWSDGTLAYEHVLDPSRQSRIRYLCGPGCRNWRAEAVELKPEKTRSGIEVVNKLRGGVAATEKVKKML